MKKVLVLGTGHAQADLIRALKQRGVYVYACSYLFGDAGQKYADEFAQLNIVDEDGIYEYVVRNDIEYVYSVGSDIAMPTVATVSDRAGLRCFVSERTARVCNTKHLLREELGDGFEGNLRFQELSSIDEALKLDTPFVIKPADSQGQRGVSMVSDVADYSRAFKAAMKFSRMGRVVVEEYADGTEISVNTFSRKGELIFFLMSDRIVWEEYPGGIIHRHLIPSVYEQRAEVAQSVRGLVSRVLSKLGITDGPAYFQIKVTSDGLAKLIEVTPRLDGCHMWRLIRYATGVDLLEMTIDLLLEGTCDAVDEYEVTPYETEFLCMPPESVIERADFDTSNADYLYWYYDDGDTVRSMNGYMEKCGYKMFAR